MKQYNIMGGIDEINDEPEVKKESNYMSIKNLKTVKNYANSVTLDSTGNAPTVQYIYRLIDSGRVSGVNIDGVKFVDYTVEVEGLSKIK